MFFNVKRYLRLTHLRILLVLMCSICSYSVMANHHIDTQNPYVMIKEVASQTFEQFDKNKALINNNRNYLKTIVAEQLMPYVDYRYSALKVMGRYVREATSDQRQRFVNAFEGYLVSTYAQALTAYTDQQVEFEPEEDFTDQKQVLVNVRIVEPGRPAIKIGFKIRRLKDGSWKAFDMIAEGVSLLRSKQAEMESLIRQHGIDSVIDMLHEKAKISISDKFASTRRSS